MILTTFGGYRLVRQLAITDDSVVHLAYPQDDAVSTVPVEIKIFAPDTPGEAVMLEIEALTRAAGEHCVSLLDLATGVDDRCALILERVPGPSLARLLADRAHLRVGEAITALAPLSVALARLHHRGVAHGAVGLDVIRLDGDGRPTLVSFGAAHLFSANLPAGRLDTEPSAALDRSRFADVARTVLASVRDKGAVELAEWISATSLDAGWLEQLELRLFALGEASSIDMEAGTKNVPQVPSRLVSARPAAPDSRIPSRSRHASPSLAMLGVPQDVADLARSVALRARSSLGAVRRPLWVAAGAVIIALVAAIALLPTTDSVREDKAFPVVAPAGDRDRANRHTPTDATTRDDPVEALVELLITRERCYADLSILCLDAVAQAGSPALDLDRDGIGSLSDGGHAVAAPIPSERLLVAERLGATALVEVDSPTNGEPASFLLMKGEAGWRIRDYLG